MVASMLNTDGLIILWGWLASYPNPHVKRGRVTLCTASCSYIMVYHVILH